MTSNYSAQYMEVVENIFNRWTALKLAVEHGMGDHKTAIDFMKYMYECCITNEKMDVYDIQDVLEDVMDREFDTTCEDNSAQEVARMLLKYLEMCKAGQYEQVSSEFSMMPSTEKWLVSGVNIQVKAAESSSDEEDEDEKEATHTSRSNKMEDDSFEEEPGWTTVRSRR